MNVHRHTAFTAGTPIAAFSNCAFRVIAHLLAALSCLALSACVLASLPGGGAEAAFAAEVQTRPLVVIVAGFDGAGEGDPVPYSDDYDWGQVIFRSNDSLAAYYDSMSLGAVAITPVLETCEYGSVNGAFLNGNMHDSINDGVVHVTLHRGYHTWGLVNQEASVASDFAQTVMDAFKEAAAFVDFASYDVNGDNVLSSSELTVALIVPGYDASTFTDPGRTDLPAMWPHSGTIEKGDELPAGYSGLYPDAYIALTENLWYENEDLADARQEPIGVLCHEIGHSLGLPDLYPLNKNPEAGSWGAYHAKSLSLMCSGGWAYTIDGDGVVHYRPTAFDVWSRYLLGWIAPEVVTESGTYQVSSQQSPDGYHALLVPTSDSSQYYLVENRLPESYDGGLATAYPNRAGNGGIVIWHVDKRMYSLHGEANELNSTDHQPGVMPLFFEMLDGATYSTDWQATTPDIGQPFYDAAAVQTLLGDAGKRIELPLYDEVGDGGPSVRSGSGIFVTIEDAAAQTMNVSIEFSSTLAGTSGTSYKRKAKSTDDAALDTPLGRVACAALLFETDADVAVVDVGSLHAGIPKGDVTFAEAYSVLPADSNIVVFDVAGQQLVDYAHKAIDQASLSSGGKSLKRPALTIGGFSFVVDLRKTAPQLICETMVGSAPLRADKTYRVATTEGVAELYGLNRLWHRNILVGYGSPADALRSFIQRENWEKAVDGLVGERTLLTDADDGIDAHAPSAGGGPGHPQDAQLTLRVVAEWVFAFAAVLFCGGVLATIAHRTSRARRRKKR